MESLTAPAQRTLLSPGGLTLLAQASGASLPVDWAADPGERDAAVLVGQRLVDVQGRPTVQVERGFAPWREPLLTVSVELAPVQRGRSTSSLDKGFSAHLTLSQDRVLSVLRRPDLGLVELSFGDAPGFGEHLSRLLAPLGSPAQGDPFELPHETFDVLSQRGGRGLGSDVLDGRADSLAAAAQLLRRTTRILTVVVARPGGVFGLRLWYDAAGWWEVGPSERAVPRTVRLRPGVPALPTLAPLVAGALG